MKRGMLHRSWFRGLVVASTVAAAGCDSVPGETGGPDTPTEIPLPPAEAAAANLVSLGEYIGRWDDVNGLTFEAAPSVSAVGQAAQGVTELPSGTSAGADKIQITSNRATPAAPNNGCEGSVAGDLRTCAFVRLRSYYLNKVVRNVWVEVVGMTPEAPEYYGVNSDTPYGAGAALSATRGLWHYGHLKGGSTSPAADVELKWLFRNPGNGEGGSAPFSFRVRVMGDLADCTVTGTDDPIAFPDNDRDCDGIKGGSLTQGVFVDPAAPLAVPTARTRNGSVQYPYRSIADALTALNTDSLVRRTLYLSTGTFTLTTATTDLFLNAQSAGLRYLGGYNPADGYARVATRTPINGLASGVFFGRPSLSQAQTTEAVLQRVNVTAASTSAAGASSLAIRLTASDSGTSQTNSRTLRLMDVRIATGAAGRGPRGSDGIVQSCTPPAGGAGGAGGSLGDEGVAGEDGSPAVTLAGGLGGPGGSGDFGAEDFCDFIEPGVAGGEGQDGLAGAGGGANASLFGSVNSAAAYTANNTGANGATGQTPGSGGGGGGGGGSAGAVCALGAGAGGAGAPGGVGGCPGSGGVAGAPGGASIPILMTNSPKTTYSLVFGPSVSLVRGAGGAGGDGGNGAAGDGGPSVAGQPGAGSGREGGAGGAGGKGGRGGGGAGGHGGPSACVVRVGTAGSLPPGAAITAACSGAAGAQGGVGGNSGFVSPGNSARGADGATGAAGGCFTAAASAGPFTACP